ncbi:MAG TPA: winged helix-turn-helix domain-containing protein [Vicinamibacterales bacterium]|nr:winged helix-turn-helix domain-containing protein [Vicinamibacterales bacterium]
MPRYHFDEFVLSSRRRLLLRGTKEQPLIPRYFDLLVFLVEHRHEAVHRRDIFDRVWTDAIVSDSALSQAIRTIRRVLGDDPREPRFIGTVSRHGYRFVCADVREEDDDGPWPPAQAGARAAEAAVIPATTVEMAPPQTDPFDPLIDRITRVARDSAEQEDQREAAELLHGLGTAEALRRLDMRPGHALGRALLRDTRWDAAEAGSVPLMGQPASLATAQALIRLRLRRASREVAARWQSASACAALAGVIGGALGGLLLASLPGSAASFAVVPVLALIGAGCGALGGAGVGAGLSAAEAAARSRRTASLVLGSAAGGGIAGTIAQWLGRWSLAALVGVHVDIGGSLEGVVIGAAAGLGYGLATSGTEGGLAAPRGARRWRVAMVTAVACGLAGLRLSVAGWPLVGGTVHAIATGSGGSQAALTPLGRLIGESDFGPVSSAISGTFEGLLFGLGLSFGLTRRR